jgi:hypothetical protein
MLEVKNQLFTQRMKNEIRSFQQIPGFLEARPHSRMQNPCSNATISSGPMNYK